MKDPDPGRNPIQKPSVPGWGTGRWDDRGLPPYPKRSLPRKGDPKEREKTIPFEAGAPDPFGEKENRTLGERPHGLVRTFLLREEVPTPFGKVPGPPGALKKGDGLKAQRTSWRLVYQLSPRFPKGTVVRAMDWAEGGKCFGAFPLRYFGKLFLITHNPITCQNAHSGDGDRRFRCAAFQHPVSFGIDARGAGTHGLLFLITCLIIFVRSSRRFDPDADLRNPAAPDRRLKIPVCGLV